MFARSRGFIYSALLFGGVALVGAGYSAQSRTRLPASLKPAPAATDIVGSTTGPLLYVQNNGTTALNTFGVTGVAGVGPDAIGVLGYGANASAANLALLGYDIGPGSVASVGYAVFPEPSTGPGSTQTTGMLGMAPDGDGVTGQTGVQHGCCWTADQPSPSDYAGVLGVDNTTNAGANAGVIGTTSNGLYGVEGISSDGAVGGVEAIATTGDGIDAYSSSGHALYAVSSSRSTIYASSSASGAIIGSATGPCCANIGVSGGSSGPSGVGVSGYATSGTTASFGVVGFGPSSALAAVGTSSTATLLNLFNASQTQVMYVDSTGNIHYMGSLISFATTQAGSVAREYVPKSTMQTIEDFGSGMLVNGSGVVHIDSSFAQMGDGTGYQVFLTPKGDSNGLYIAQESASSFVVRESRGGRSTLAFDYRIVAKQYGHSAERASIAQSVAGFESSHAVPPPRPAQSLFTDATPHARASRQRNSSNTYNTYAIPRAATGLVQGFGH